MKNSFPIIIDMKSGAFTTAASYKQGDTHTGILNMTIKDNGVPVDITGQSITFNFTTSKGAIVIQDETTDVSIIDPLTGNFQCIIKNNVLADPGICKCEITFSEGTDIFTTATFNFNVNASIGNGDNTIGADYISVVENQIVAWQTEITPMKTAYEAAVTLSAANATIEYAAAREGFDTLPLKMADLDGKIAANTTGIVTNNASILAKIKTAIFNPTASATTHIIHGLVYDRLHDDLNVIDTYSGHICTLTTEYTENADTLSIDLVGWSIGVGDIFKFVLYKNVK